MKFLDSNGLTKLWELINTIVNKKVDKVSGKGLSTNDYTTIEKNKLAGISEGANKIIVDSSLNSTSINPVQNNVINTALNSKVPNTRTINTKALSGDISLNASDVGAAEKEHYHTQYFENSKIIYHDSDIEPAGSQGMIWFKPAK